ncbi:regulatory protein RecX [Marinomonas agarivorans]|nr:regulatory protein RecX [Marinomonas agarivorans]
MPITYSQIRDTALLILSKREHSRQELEQKLKRRFPDHKEDVANLLQELADENMQNDHRFAASFLRNRLAKPYGKNRIISELRQKGIKQDSIDYAFSTEPDVDWFELAKQLKQRKFGDKVATDYKEKAKQFRYLQYRGFGFDEIHHATQDTGEE